MSVQNEDYRMNRADYAIAEKLGRAAAAMEIKASALLRPSA
jgi:hypothetical protein